MTDDEFLFQLQFQFTPLREGLQTVTGPQLKVLHFNSRPCERGFPDALLAPESPLISIHAPARGASWLWQVNLLRQVFQFTPLREGLRW